MSKQLSKVFVLLRPWLLWLALASLSAIIVNLLEMAVPLQVRSLINAIFGDNGIIDINWRSVGVLVCLLALSQVFKIVQRLATEWPATRIGATLFQQGVHHLLSYPMKWFSTAHSGALQVRLERSTRAISDLIKTGLMDLLSPLIGIVMSLTLMWQASYKVGLVASMTIPLLVGITVWQAKNQAGIRIAINHKREEQGVRVAEAVMGIEQVKLFRAEQSEAARAWNVSCSLADKEYAHHRAMAMFDLAKFWIEWAGFGSVLIYGILDAKESGSTLGVGGILMILMLYGRVADTMRHLHRVIDETNEKWILAKDYLRILEVKPVIRTGANRTNRTSQNLDCENVTFAYSDVGKIVLENVSFHAAGGEKVAVVGQSGSGKSTLAKLLAGLYAADRGRILLGGQEVKPVEHQGATGIVGMLSQEIYIFAGTVAENIRYGCPIASDDEVRWAAEIAGLGEFVEVLENGYDTQLGQRGNGLSGGQKQRLALARVLLQDPDVIIFDEPSASLDPENTRRFFDIVLRVFQGKTVVVITHDLDNILWANQIVMLEKGRIREMGALQELCIEGTAFCQLRDGSFPPQLVLPEGVGALPSKASHAQ